MNSLIGTLALILLLILYSEATKINQSGLSKIKVASIGQNGMQKQITKGQKRPFNKEVNEAMTGNLEYLRWGPKY